MVIDTNASSSEMKLEMLNCLLKRTFVFIRLSADWRIEEINERFLELFAYDTNEIYGENLRTLLNGKTTIGEIFEVLQHGEQWIGECGFVTKWEEMKWMESTYIPIIGEEGDLVEILSFHLDRTDEKNAVKWKVLANRNELTQLPNRRQLLSAMDAYIGRAEQNETRFAVLFLDINHFKQINDTYGHHMGDLLLIEVGKRLSSIPYQGLELFHMSGDEFILLLEDLANIDKVIQRILSVFDEAFLLEAVCLKVGVSIGISRFPDHSRNAEFLIRFADQAMYGAKATATAHSQYGFYNETVLHVCTYKDC